MATGQLPFAISFLSQFTLSSQSHPVSPLVLLCLSQRERPPSATALPAYYTFCPNSHSTRRRACRTSNITITLSSIPGIRNLLQQLIFPFFGCKYVLIIRGASHRSLAKPISGWHHFARSSGNLSISDRFIGPSDLWGWVGRPYFRVAPSRLHPKISHHQYGARPNKDHLPQITSPQTGHMKL